MVENPNICSNAQITFQTPPEAVNKMFGMLQAAQYMGGGALLVALLAALGSYLFLTGEHREFEREISARKQVRDAQIEAIRIEIASASKEARLCEYDDGELRDTLIQQGFRIPPNPFKRSK